MAATTNHTNCLWDPFPSPLDHQFQAAGASTFPIESTLTSERPFSITLTLKAAPPTGNRGFAMLSQLRFRPFSGSSFLKPSKFSRPLSSTASWRNDGGELNKVSATVTQPKSQGASQAMRSFPFSGVLFFFCGNC